MQKSICVRTHRAKTGYLPPSIYEVHFDSYPLPLLRRFIVGAAIEKNFFYFSESFNSIQVPRYFSGVSFFLVYPI